MHFVYRNIFLAELVEDRLETLKTVTIKFSEFESSLATVKAKVVDALGHDESIVLVDSHHNEIMDCEGTRGISISYIVINVDIHFLTVSY